MQGEIESKKVLLPTWLAQVFEEMLEIVLHKHGCVRLVEELGEVGGIEVIEWVSAEGDQRAESLSLTIRQHGNVSSLVEVSCTSRRMCDLVFLAALKLVSECMSSIRQLDERLDELLSGTITEVEGRASLIESGLSARM
ncbi:MAG: hypothetical protein RMK18_03410 [Armatimonadota bacterium]|nr:hypothetical protein [Armatimonadota bacterium]MCX7777034.1 hypothetical protein [Armatimonadota bacterium]MDW8024898.1 hypothetical protein [Armatimonadota bacterium]